MNRNAYFPFHALGLRGNPFRALTDEEWAAVVLLSEPVAALLTHGGPHLQILGPMGSGKTSALLGIEARLREEGRRVAREYLAEGERRYRTATEGMEVFLLDEAQRLSARERRRLLAEALRRDAPPLRLILGSHEDLTLLFARRGLPLATARLDAPCPARLAAMVERRLAFFALPGGPRLTVGPEALAWLTARFGPDLRAAERLLYEVFQRLPAPGVLKAGDLERSAACLPEEAGPDLAGRSCRLQLRAGRFRLFP